MSILRQKPGSLPTIQNQKSFIHDLVPRLDLPRETLNNLRYYRTPEGFFPSVTSILSLDTSSQEGLNAWRARVGEEEANLITEKASRQGTEVHNLLECYLSNQPVIFASYQQYYMFETVRTWLDQNVEKVLGLELPLYTTEVLFPELSNTGVAGTADALVLTKTNALMLLDFKTSSTDYMPTYKLDKYWKQIRAYASMIKYTYNLIPEYVTILSISNTYQLSVYTESTKKRS